MEYDGCFNQYDDPDDIWLDEESAGPANYPFNDYFINHQGYSKSGGRYGTNAIPSQDPRSRFSWGRGYGPAGPPNMQSFPRENDTESFLLRCGVHKAVLKGLPKVLLNLMGPEYCGVCAQVLDNYDGARLHYISKNHSKNLKKWLAQKAKVGSKRPQEVPLRARELYCELCDIHITSKSHADSHYAGKSHRAIIDGRKVPKNPFLLQNNMRGRVEQLIRREKKSLKPTEKLAATEIAKTDTNAFAPELYCDICKASVTSSEQMTMHLNGKRHLSKEKRHIFNVMKGNSNVMKATPAVPAEPATTVKDADAKGEGDWEKRQTNNHEDDFDWGHGSGTWDDDPQ